jgi:hypothetical protein
LVDLFLIIFSICILYITWFIDYKTSNFMWQY